MALSQAPPLSDACGSAGVREYRAHTSTCRGMHGKRDLDLDAERAVDQTEEPERKQRHRRLISGRDQPAEIRAPACKHAPHLRFASTVNRCQTCALEHQQAHERGKHQHRHWSFLRSVCGLVQSGWRQSLNFFFQWQCSIGGTLPRVELIQKVSTKRLSSRSSPSLLVALLLPLLSFPAFAQLSNKRLSPHLIYALNLSHHVLSPHGA